MTWTPTTSTNGHQWGIFNKDAFECCKQCGLVRRRDDKNSQCKGRVRVEMRAKRP
jgi:hypothetical protein